MTHLPTDVILRNAHVIDPKNGINEVTCVLVRGGRIASVGMQPTPAGVEEIDLAGKYLSPGWIDLHVHAYGALGFSDPDSIGIRQGVTTFVDAGGAGIGVMDEFEATMQGLRTSLYAGPFVRPLGLIGLSFVEGEIRSLGNIPLTQWVDYMQDRGDLIRYLKCNAMGNYGPGSLKISKGLAQVLDVPLYMHIGEFQQHEPDVLLAMEAFRVAQEGDMITHIYHGNVGKIVDKSGQVLPIVRQAQERGVLFDIGFGGFNFSWAVAEPAFEGGLIPDIISSDLQQYNVVKPTKSLANVMAAIMHLGMKLEDAIARVTSHPARALSLDDRAGSLAVGMPADITVFDVLDETHDIFDCFMQSRSAAQKLQPVMVFKNGERFDCDMEVAQAESNWLMEFADDWVPARAASLTQDQHQFLDELARVLHDTYWELHAGKAFDYDKALVLQQRFHEARGRTGLSVAIALESVYSCFSERKITLQIGLFLLCIERDIFFKRVSEITQQHTTGASA